MAQNVNFNANVNIEGVSYDVSIDRFSSFHRNFDYTQIFDKINITISKKYNIGYTIQKNTFIVVSVNNFTHTFVYKKKKEFSDRFQLECNNIFESFSDLFLASKNPDGNYRVNANLESAFTPESFNTSSPEFVSYELWDLLRVCLSEIAGLDYNLILLDNNYKIKDFNGGDLIFFVGPSFNEDFFSWYLSDDKSEIVIDFFDVLKLMQKLYCFSLSFNYLTSTLRIDAGPVLFVYEGSPITLENNLYRDPAFFSLDTILSKFDPSLLYSKRSTFDLKDEFDVFLKPRKVVGSYQGQEVVFAEYEYRSGVVDIEEIKVPANFFKLGRARVPKPLQIDFVNGNYVLQSGFYPAYIRYFSLLDISLNNIPLLDFFEFNSYIKQIKFFDDSLDFGKLQGGDLSREVKFSFSNFNLSVESNIPLLKNSIRG